MSKHPSLKNYLEKWTGKSDIRRDISRTVEAIAEACKEISALVARGPDAPVWAGVVPLELTRGEPVDAPDILPGVTRPDYL